MLDRKQKESLLEDLKSLQKRTATLIKVIDDCDVEDIDTINQVSEIYSELFSKILTRQKQRGKKFISDAKVDALIDQIKEEEGIKKFDDFKNKE